VTWPASVVTLYPEMFPGPLGASLAGKGLADGAWSLALVNPRDFATDRHRSVDDTPFGGGPGMVLRPDTLAAAIDHADRDAPDRPRLLFTPRGTPITQARIRALAAGPGAILICGRFEGVDERVIGRCGLEEVSVADVVLSGGELAAMLVLDASVRLLPGVMGATESGHDESFEAGLLEYPQFTRPAVWEGAEVPPVLASGDHAAIGRWRQFAARGDTRRRRPDLWAKYLARRPRRGDKPGEFE
jgi:tRNA (guanine37-N1)-methyltransferase